MVSPIEDTDLAPIWQQVATSITEIDSSRLFITGGTGFFGCWLLESLRYAKKHLGLRTEVVVLTRDPGAFAKKMPHLVKMPGLTLWSGDVVNFTYPTGPFTHVIHAATEASASLNQEQPLIMLDTIVEGTRRVLDFSVQLNVRKFLLTSSGGIYGTQPPTLSHIDETYYGAPDPLNLTSAYGLGKRMAEHLCMIYSNQYGFDVKIARCFAFVGPYLPLTTHFAIGNFIHNAGQHHPIQIMGDGSPYRSYLYASDLVVWLWTILCQGESGRAYNVGSEEAINLASLAKLVAKSAQVELPIVIAKKPDPDVLPARYVPQTQRAQKELQLKQTVNLEDSIQRTLRWSLRQ
jgi:nucleoside-diphosphate-sugar epimerase